MHHNHTTSLYTILSTVSVYDFSPYHQGSLFTMEQTDTRFNFSVIEEIRRNSIRSIAHLEKQKKKRKYFSFYQPNEVI